MPHFDVERQQSETGQAPHYDYDSEEFYEAIEQLAKNGATDKEIAIGLKHVIGVSIRPNRFIEMKNGNYECWTDEENERRGGRIRETLIGARLDTNRMIKAVYLRTALGKNQVKSTTVVKRRMRIDGQLTDNEEIQTTEVTSGIAPNMQALSLWLHNHDKEWRKAEQGGDDDMTPNDAPVSTKVKKGVDITAWLDKELMNKEDEGEK